MFGLKKQFHELMKIFSRQNVGISEKDPRFLADFYRYNLPFDIASAILLCIVSFIGMAGTHAPFAAGTVLPEISATAVYMMLFGTNLLFLMLLFQEFRRFDSTAVRRTKWIILTFRSANMVLASMTFFSTQKNSGFFFEYILVTMTILLVPNSRFITFLRNAGLNLVSVILVLALARHPIAWQDMVDLLALFIVCGFVNWVRWLTFRRVEANRLSAEKQREKLFRESRTDDLTGLLNRTALRDDFPDYTGRLLCIALIDLDAFKLCNDTYGHAYGDMMLRSTGERMQRIFSGAEYRCYRYGGDEFLILYNGGDRDLFYNKLLEFCGSGEKQPKEPDVTCGTGYCCGIPRTEREIRSMIRIADEYLYRAKSAGRSRMSGSLTPVDIASLYQGNSDSLFDHLMNIDDAAKIFQRRNMENKAWSIAYLNINRYGEINEDLGYREGGALLKKINQILLRHFPSAVLVNREMDHFVLFSTLSAKDFLHRVRKVQAEVFRMEERHMIIFRAGVFHHEAADPPTDYLTGMYHAKYACDAILSANDGDPYLRLYDHAMAREQEKDLFVHQEFFEALKSGRIVPYYQPIVGSLSGITCGYEALSRWLDPEKDVISPADYIPYLEETGEVYRLDLHILEQVCRDIRDHRKQFPENIFVNVNLSQKDFQYMDMPEEIDRIVTAYKVPKSQLHLEITESAFTDSRRLGDALMRLQKLGFHIWMDDFGVGESSLSAFRNNRVEGVKLDQSFFADVANHRTQIIIRSIIDMSRETNCMMIAEGIENLEQLRCARQWGVNFIQGFYFSRPMPLSELLASHFVGNRTDESTDHFYQAAAEVHLAVAYEQNLYLQSNSPVASCRAVLEWNGAIRVLRANDYMQDLLDNFVEIEDSECILKPDSEIASTIRKAIDIIHADHHICDFRLQIGQQTFHGQLALIAEDPPHNRTAYILNITNFSVTAA